ncbi:uncharacterized protein N7446_004316 [Penicillium canescens]|uniref:uncharacterized protein n=1 Tax=Penicillium canescens TaxID=5083 RepID=UPI0026DF9EFC|nr:uncharacterized protein N7446_004316 [Penicillium canescens]KAJ6067279.1 hypothetical protein N7446_004316 [Penicillium canescens]
MATPNRNIRVTMFAYKNDAMSEEQFDEHWSAIHAPIVALSHPSSMRKLVHGQYERAGSAHPPFPDNDGLVEIVVPDMETYMSLSKRPYYKKTVAPDEAKFFDWAKTRVAFGWEETYVENGQSLVLNERVAKL